MKSPKIQARETGEGANELMNQRLKRDELRGGGDTWWVGGTASSRRDNSILADEQR